MSTYNPNTGQFGAMQDPFLRKLYGNIINLAGTSLTSSDLKPQAPSTPQAPTQTGTPMPDMTAIQSPAPLTTNQPTMA